ncbi:hypothetical protein COU74_03810 [Candidatus Peregrinibacteria bacterium CG10_big_fil_rev_8_21_14_0_10_36_19]|nr:MAG: hypothetical protein COU74_03810 [Candidatus Peregrinibacteria bacterium CG10_big_fil_rev_8_21_14_0_10_36_19]
MQYKVPQDVQREDTIIGPLTLKQIGILGIGGGIAYAIYVTLAKNWMIEVWLPPTGIVVMITLAFAFLKVHNLPFHIYLMSLIEFHYLPKKRIWIQGAGTPFVPPFQEKKIEKKIDTAPKKEQKSIEELAEILDSKGKKHSAIQEIANQNLNK